MHKTTPADFQCVRPTGTDSYRVDPDPGFLCAFAHARRITFHRNPAFSAGLHRYVISRPLRLRQLVVVIVSSSFSEGATMGGRFLALAGRRNCGVLAIALLLGYAGFARLCAADDTRPATEARDLF